MGKKINFFLILIGAAAIGLGFTKYISEDMTLYLWGGGGALILLVIIYLIWRSKRNKKLAPALPGGKKMGGFDPKKLAALADAKKSDMREAQKFEDNAIRFRRLRPPR